MTKAIPEKRGDFDRGRIKDALIFRADGVRAGLFVNEVGDIGCCVDLPEGGALTFSIAPNDLIHLLRAKLAAPQPAQTAPEAQPAVTQAGAAVERDAARYRGPSTLTKYLFPLLTKYLFHRRVQRTARQSPARRSRPS